MNKPRIRLHYTGHDGWYAEVSSLLGYKTIYYPTSQLHWLYRDLAWWLS